jgi:hypothetical protein
MPPVPPVPPVWFGESSGNSAWGFPAAQPAPQKQDWQAPAEVNRSTGSNEPLVTPAPQSNSSNSATPEYSTPVNEPAPPSAPGSDKKSRQLDILQAIERGEISVDEGMRRLGEIEQ